MKARLIISYILMMNTYPILAVNKCTDENGKITYQEKKCANNTKSETLDILTTKSPRKQFHEIPNQKWRLVYSAPKMKKIQESNSGQGYQYIGESNKTGFVMSIYVEPSLGKGIDKYECGNYYWQRASKNPMIIQNTVDQLDTNEFIIVNYIMEAKSKGQTVLHVNTNLYGYRAGKCIDVHVSQAFLDPKAINFNLLINFAGSLQYAKLESKG